VQSGRLISLFDEVDDAVAPEPFHKHPADLVPDGLLRALRPYEAHSGREGGA
jgi:hypothetical protein